jgi:hypothetical protein
MEVVYAISRGWDSLMLDQPYSNGWLATLCLHARETRHEYIHGYNLLWKTVMIDLAAKNNNVCNIV